MEKFHNDILLGENSYYNVDHETSERDLSYFIFFSEELPIQKPINTMKTLMILSSFDYLAIVDASIVLLLLLVVAMIVYITGFYDEFHPIEKADATTRDGIDTPEIYFVKMNTFTGMANTTSPAITKNNRITKSSE